MTRTVASRITQLRKILHETRLMYLCLEIERMSIDNGIEAIGRVWWPRLAAVSQFRVSGWISWDVQALPNGPASG
jgi:hypothetical protein